MSLENDAKNIFCGEKKNYSDFMLRRRKTLLWFLFSHLFFALGKCFVAAEKKLFDMVYGEIFE
jgi:hypothetical protein